MYLYPGVVAISGLSAPLLGGWLMDQSIWRPFQVAICLTLLSLVIVMAIHEDWQLSNSSKLDRPSSGDSQSLDSTQTPRSIAGRDEHQYASVSQEDELSTQATAGTHSVAWGQLYTKNLLLCYTMFFVKRLAFTSEAFIYQYAAQYLRWPLRQTTKLQFSRATGATVVNTALIPGISTYIVNSDVTIRGRLDRGLIAVSACILTSGFWLLWVAQTPKFFFLGKSSPCTQHRQQLNLARNSHGHMRDRGRP